MIKEDMKTRSPLVTIIIPVYNVEDYLERCVDSVCGQTYENLEILLINDGSTDRSGEICDQYGRQDARIKVFHQQNMGLSAARNTGLDAAHGDYIAFVDSDDCVAATFIQVMLGLAEKMDSDIVQVSVKSFLGKKQPDDEYDGSLLPTENLDVLSGRDMCKALMKHVYEGCGVVWNKIYKAHLFEEGRFRVGKIHEDDFLVYRLFWQANKIVVSDWRLYYYQSKRPGSIMHQKYSTKRLNGIEARKEQILFFESVGDQELCQYAKVEFIRNTVEQIKLLKASDIGDKKVIISRIHKDAVSVLKSCMFWQYIPLTSKVSILIKMILAIL